MTSSNITLCPLGVESSDNILLRVISMLFCRRIRDSVSDLQYYLLIDLHEDAEDFEHGTSFDVEATDGQTGWCEQGMAYGHSQLMPNQSRLTSKVDFVQVCTDPRLKLQTGCP